MHYDTTLADYRDSLNENRRTRTQKQKDLMFTFNIIQSDDDQPMPEPMEIDDIVKSNQSTNDSGIAMKIHSTPKKHSLCMDMETEMAKNVESFSEPPKVPQAIDDEDMFCDEETQPKQIGKIRVNFIDFETGLPNRSMECDRNAPFEEIFKEFAEFWSEKVTDHEFFGPDKEILRKQKGVYEVKLNDEQKEITIYFRNKKKTKSRATKKEPPIRKKSTEPHYIHFIDKTGTLETMALGFDGKTKLSAAVAQLAEVIDTTPADLDFRTAKGMYLCFLLFFRCID